MLEAISAQMSYTNRNMNAANFQRRQIRAMQCDVKNQIKLDAAITTSEKTH